MGRHIISVQAPQTHQISHCYDKWFFSSYFVTNTLWRVHIRQCGKGPYGVCIFDNVGRVLMACIFDNVGRVLMACAYSTMWEGSLWRVHIRQCGKGPYGVCIFDNVGRSLMVCAYSTMWEGAFGGKVWGESETICEAMNTMYVYVHWIVRLYYNGFLVNEGIGLILIEYKHSSIFSLCINI